MLSGGKFQMEIGTKNVKFLNRKEIKPHSC